MQFEIVILLKFFTIFHIFNLKKLKKKKLEAYPKFSYF